MLLEKIKALNPICRMVNEHRRICTDVVDEAKKIIETRTTQVQQLQYDKVFGGHK